MPLPLPWFDNQIDPLLPVDIKPLLYLYDQYQTYDLVEWSGLTIYWNNNTFPFDFLSYKTVGEVSTILVERFTPWSYDWAEHYSTKIFNFIYDYTGTDYASVAYISGLFYDFTSGHQWEGEFFYDRREDYISNEQVTLNIPATQQEQIIIITWLEYDYLDIASSQINSKLKAILVKRYKKFTTSKASKSIVFDLNSVALCSIVVSSSSTELASSIKQQLNAQRGVLYDNLDSILAELKSKLAIAFPRLFKVIDTISYHYEIDVKAEGDYRGTSFNAQLGGSGYDSYILGDVFKTATFTYRERPQHYRSACLLYANNNYWSNGIVHSDLGKTPNFFTNPLLPQYYQPPYPSHDLIYIENLNFPDSMSEVKKQALIPGNTHYDGRQDPDHQIEMYFTGQPPVYDYKPSPYTAGSLLKTTSGEKHYLYNITSVWHYMHPESAAGAYYDVYKFYCILTHEGNGIISSKGGDIEYLGRNSKPDAPYQEGDIFRYSDSQRIDVVVNYHYFENDDNNGISTTPYRIALSNETAITFIDNYLYQSSIAGEFDNA